MDLKEIKELIDVMNEHGLVEIEIEKGGNKIRLKKDYEGKMVPVMLNNKTSESNTANFTQSRAPQVNDALSRNKQIKSPMIGTFYRAPHPDAPPFIEVGDMIEPEQVVCIIEAMKLMNEIKSEIKGKVVQIMADNSDPVEFGQPLFLVEEV